VEGLKRRIGEMEAMVVGFVFVVAVVVAANAMSRTSLSDQFASWYTTSLLGPITIQYNTALLLF
jgi:hypothetical protein